MRGDSWLFSRLLRAERLERYVFAVAVAIALTSTAAHAQAVRFVRADAPPGGDGASWATAYQKVFHALDEAATDPGITQIWIVQGTHSPNRGSGNRNDSFVLVPNVTLYGGFIGDETELQQRDPVANLTTLSGDFNGNDGPPGTFTGVADNARHVVSALNFPSPQPAALDGLTIRGGNADFNPNLLLGGGGLFVQSANVNTVGCTFIANSAGLNSPNIGGFGGAIYNFGGEVVASDSLFTANRGDNGGAIGVRPFNDGPYRAAFANCQFIENTAAHQTGGAVWTGANPFDTVERELTFESCLFEDNLAQYGGAIIEQNTKHVRFSDCVFQGNQALVVGGAMWLNQSAGTDQEAAFLTRCTFIDNQSNDHGGAIFCTVADMLITNCEFLGNTAIDGTGGAIRSGPQFGTNFGVGDLELYNCAFAGNSASFVGAVAALRNPIAKIVNCTVANNSASVGPGGVFSDAFDLQIDNTVLWNNVGAGSTQAQQLTHLTTFGPLLLNHSCVQGLDGSLGGVGNIGDDPVFVDADGADDVPGTLDDNLRVLAKSPVIDAGDAAALPVDSVDLDGDANAIEPLPLDLDDQPRVAGPQIDMGAFEIQPQVAGDVTGDGVVDIDDLLAVVNAWGSCPAPPAACAADLDGSGTVDVDDLLLVINNWS